SACVPKLINGTPVPNIMGHTPTLDGTCTATVGTAVCLSTVCDTKDNECGLGNGDGPCDATSGATVCRSGVCDKDGSCGLADGDGPCTTGDGAVVCRSGSCNGGVCGKGGAPCAKDADCSSSQFCNTAKMVCEAKLPNGDPVPKIPGHDPAFTGVCSAAVG